MTKDEQVARRFKAVVDSAAMAAMPVTLAPEFARLVADTFVALAAPPSPAQEEKYYSGDASEGFWYRVNATGDMGLYSLACQLQDLEGRVLKLLAEDRTTGGKEPDMSDSKIQAGLSAVPYSDADVAHAADLLRDAAHQLAGIASDEQCERYRDAADRLVPETLVTRAQRIASTAYGRQTQRRDSPRLLVTHAAAVAARVERRPETRLIAGYTFQELARATAWLHDVLEDTALTVEHLRTQFPSVVVEAVQLLTRDGVFKDGVNYSAYIRRMCEHATDPVRRQGPAAQIARAVKRADLLDHLRPDSEWPLPETLRQRYQLALLVLRAVDNLPLVDCG